MPNIGLGATKSRLKWPSQRSFSGSFPPKPLNAAAQQRPVFPSFAPSNPTLSLPTPSPPSSSQLFACNPSSTASQPSRNGGVKCRQITKGRAQNKTSILQELGKERAKTFNVPRGRTNLRKEKRKKKQDHPQKPLSLCFLSTIRQATLSSRHTSPLLAHLRAGFCSCYLFPAPALQATKSRHRHKAQALAAVPLSPLFFFLARLSFASLAALGSPFLFSASLASLRVSAS